MNLLIVIVLGLLLLLLVVMSLLAFSFYKFSREKAAPDAGAALLQKEVAGLRQQLFQSLSDTTKILNQQMASVSSQIQQQMSSVSQSMQTTAGQIHTRLDSASQMVQSVQGQLSSLSKATEQIFEATKNISALEEILKPPKLRGLMGEILLENILREILPSEGFFSLQYGFKNGETVDAVIRLKDGLIPIDAKYPLDNFRRMLEAKDEKERQAARREFVKNVKNHIDAIAKKYILPDEGTFNFALMYIPAENVYYEVMIREEKEGGSGDLYAYATQKRIFPVSPNSLYPYLMTLALGFRGLKIEQQAKDILRELDRLHGDLAKFSEDYRIVGDHLTNAQKKFADSEKRLERVQNKIEQLKDGSTGEPPKISVIEP